MFEIMTKLNKNIKKFYVNKHVLYTLYISSTVCMYNVHACICTCSRNIWLYAIQYSNQINWVLLLKDWITLMSDDCTSTNFLWKCLKRRHVQRRQITYFYYCEWARWTKSCTVISYPSGQDGAISNDKNKIWLYSVIQPFLKNVLYIQYSKMT